MKKLIISFKSKSVGILSPRQLGFLLKLKENLWLPHETRTCDSWTSSHLLCDTTWWSLGTQYYDSCISGIDWNDLFIDVICHQCMVFWWLHNCMCTLGRRQSRTPILSRNVDKKSLENRVSIAICRHTGDKWQSKTLFLSIFDPRLSIVDSVFDRCLPGVMCVSEPVHNKNQQITNASSKDSRDSPSPSLSPNHHPLICHQLIYANNLDSLIGLWILKDFF